MRKAPTRERILAYIGAYSAAHGFPPSMREISAAMGLKSVSTVHKHIKSLKNEELLAETDGTVPRSLVIRSQIDLSPDPAPKPHHLCLNTDTGDHIILNCAVTGGRLRFSGAYRILGGSDCSGHIIACRELDDADYDAMMY